MSGKQYDYDEVREEIENLTVNLNGRWKLYKELFEPKENAEIFNKAAPLVWMYLRDGLLDHLLLGISRLLDPEKMSGRWNFTIERLINLCPHDFSEGDRFEKLKKSYKNGLRLHRHRSIAHNDEQTLLKFEALPIIDIEYIDGLLSDINTIVNDLAYGANSGISVELVPGVSPPRWVPQIIHLLEEALEARECKRQEAND